MSLPPQPPPFAVPFPVSHPAPCWPRRPAPCPGSHPAQRGRCLCWAPGEGVWGPLQLRRCLRNGVWGGLWGPAENRTGNSTQLCSHMGIPGQPAWSSSQMEGLPLPALPSPLPVHGISGCCVLDASWELTASPARSSWSAALPGITRIWAEAWGGPSWAWLPPPVGMSQGGQLTPHRAA